MSAADGAGGGTTSARRPGLTSIGMNAKATLATLVRPPRRAVPWPSARECALLLAGAAVAVFAVMVTLDGWAIAQVPRLPAGLVEAFNRFTDFGKGGFFLWPLGLAMIGLALLDTSRLPRMPRLVLAAWTVRLGFVFTAIALPGLFVTIVKRLIGRARPLVAGNDAYRLPAVRLEGRLCEPAVRPRDHGLCGAGRDRRDLSPGAGADVDLRRADRAEPGGADRALSERRGGRRHCRRGRRLAGAAVVCRPGAGFCRIGQRRRAADARAKPAAHRQIACPPLACCLEARGMSEVSTSAPAVSVIVPVRNEAGNIAPLVAEIAAALAGRRFEVIYVNDGSTDGTEAELNALRAAHPWLRQVRHAQSCGQSAALRTGILSARGGIVVTLDGDGQNDPAFLPKLIEALEQRRAEGRPDRGPARRPQGHGLQEIPVARGQRGARLDPARRHAQLRLRA